MVPDTQRYVFGVGDYFYGESPGVGEWSPAAAASGVLPLAYPLFPTSESPLSPPPHSPQMVGGTRGSS